MALSSVSAPTTGWRFVNVMSSFDTRQTLLIRMRDVEDAGAWSEFVELYTPLIFHFCQQRGLQEADAADVAQEVLTTVANKIREFEYDPEKGQFRSWLLTVTRFKLSHLLKKKQRGPQPAGGHTVVRMLDQQSESDRDENAVWEREYRKRVFQWACYCQRE